MRRSDTTQDPLNVFIIALDMIAGHTMVLSVMATSLLASGVHRWLLRPLYQDPTAFRAPLLPQQVEPEGVADTGYPV